MHYKKKISFILIFFFTFLLQAGAFAQASFEGLGYLTPGAFPWSDGNGITADGSVIVGTIVKNDSVFIYTDADGIRNLKEVLENDYGLDLTGWTFRWLVC